MPEVPWAKKRCIVCLSEEILTVEHVIPAGVGGRLCARFLCKNCNNILGHRVDATVQKNASVRLAIRALKTTLPKLFLRIETGQNYSINLGGQTVASKMSKLGDLAEASVAGGSIVVPERSQTKHISNILKRAGCNEDAICVALQLAEDAPFDQKTEIAPGIRIVKWMAPDSFPVLQTTPFPALAALKMSFESLALGLGAHIYDDFLTITNVQTALQAFDVQFAERHVSFHLATSDYLPFHGIHLKGVDDNVEVQIRLFGKIAILCKFPNISADWLDVVYTQSLETTDFSVADLRDVPPPNPHPEA